MPIYVEWLDDLKTVLHYRLTDGWGWDDYHAANTHIRNLLDNAPHPVDIICDFSDSVVFPPRMIANFGRTLRQTPHSKQGRIVMVGVNGLLQILWGVIRNLHPEATAQIMLAHTHHHALRMMKETVETRT